MIVSKSDVMMILLEERIKIMDSVIETMKLDLKYAEWEREELEMRYQKARLESGVEDRDLSV